MTHREIENFFRMIITEVDESEYEENEYDLVPVKRKNDDKEYDA